MRISRFARALVFVLGCGGGSSGDDDDDIDAPGPGIDTPAGPACTNATFDPCTSNAECTSGDCHLFMGDGFQVCTQSCTPNDNTTCPTDKSGANATCNNKGICKPSAPNDCTR
jgi:hypothetical protein